MHKHRETGKIVKVTNMDTSTTYVDEEGHSRTLDTSHFNALYEDTLETGSFGADDVSVAELLVEIDRMKQDHAATVEALNKHFDERRKDYQTQLDEAWEAHKLADSELQTANGVALEQAKRIAELEGQVSELTKPKEAGKK